MVKNLVIYQKAIPQIKNAEFSRKLAGLTAKARRSEIKSHHRKTYLFSFEESADKVTGTFTFASCSPFDNFERAKGRTIAAAKAENDKVPFTCKPHELKALVSTFVLYLESNPEATTADLINSLL